MRGRTIFINNIGALTSNNRRQISSTNKISARNEKIIYSRMELDSHADSIVVGANCCIMHYTSRECDVSPYREDYTPIKMFPLYRQQRRINHHGGFDATYVD